MEKFNLDKKEICVDTITSYTNMTSRQIKRLLVNQTGEYTKKEFGKPYYLTGGFPHEVFDATYEFIRWNKERKNASNKEIIDDIISSINSDIQNCFNNYDLFSDNAADKEECINKIVKNINNIETFKRYKEHLGV